MSIEAPERYLAILRRGEVYFLGSIQFDHGLKIVVEQHHKDHLEEHAVDTVGGDDDEVTIKDKFEFLAYEGTEKVGTVIGGKRLNDMTRDRDSIARMQAYQDAEELRRVREAKRIADEPPPRPIREERAPETRTRMVPRAPVRVQSVNYEDGTHEEVTEVPRPPVRVRARG